MIRILCLTAEEHLLHQITVIFPDWSVDYRCYGHLEHFLDSLSQQRWDAYYIDVDVLPGTSPSLMEVTRQIGAGNNILISGSSSFAEWHQELYELGAVVLQKPVTSGEIGMALRRMVTKDV